MVRKKTANEDLTIRPNATGVIDYSECALSDDVDQNIALMRSIFRGDDMVLFRTVENNATKTRFGIVYVDGMINAQLLSLNLIQPLLDDNPGVQLTRIDEVESRLVSCNELKRNDSAEKLTNAVMSGNAVVFMDGSTEALIVGVKGFSTRSVTEPDNEKVLLGPREGFNESLMINLSLLRRKLQTPDLKCSFSYVGSRSPTRLCVCYLDSMVERRVLDDLNRRLSSMDIDSVLDSNYIVESIQDHRWSLFKTINSTEKPDTVASRLLEGRIAVFVDGSPMVLTLPCLFIENFQASDDYYLNFFFSNVGRLLRIIGFVLTVSVPAVYVALVNFHQETIPAPLMYSIAIATVGVPFPTVLECFIMLLIFEILREAGIRSSTKIGQALSLVGGLVIGQAAVEAKIVSAPMVIVVAMAGITGLIVPDLRGPSLILRFACLCMAAMSGILGFYFVWLLVFIHLMSLESFGYPYVRDFWRDGHPLTNDSSLRVPIWMMRMRPGFARDRRRRS